MKKIFLISLLICLTGITLYGQSLKYKKFKNGKFQSTYNGRTTIIDRKGQKQTEYLFNSKDSLKMSFDVKWLNDSTYTLAPSAELHIKYPQMPANALITVKMTNVTRNSYRQSSTSNFLDKTIVSTVTKIE